MIIPKQKIQVFISSACGDEPEKQKYNYVRAALKVIIESTEFAEVYVFESEGASTASAGRHYTFALEDSDVCIFLIDNSDGVPDGVQKEIDTAKKHGIKSLFYFCAQSSKEETPLQKSLKGAQFAKSVVVHDFKDFIKRGAVDLVNDLVSMYKHYCKGRLTLCEEFLTEQSPDIVDIELATYSDNIASKDVLSNIDCCVEYFTKLILELSFEEDKKTGDIDRFCAAFLPVLFEGATVNKDSLDSLLAVIEKHQTTQHFAVTKKRYEAIMEYYSGNLEACVCKLNEALQTAKAGGLPEWLTKDILIDLRNQNSFLKESQNIFPWTEYQEELDSSNALLYYPLLDRLDSNFYQGIIDEAIKYKIQDLGTINLGHGLSTHIKSLASIFVLSMYNGSLSHLRLLYKRVKYITFYCASRYSNWSIKKLLLKTVVVDGRKKEIDGIIRCFDDLRSRMNEKDANEIYAFANNNPIRHQKIIAKLEAFKITCYYMDNDNFNNAWVELHEFISRWIEDKDSTIVIGNNIFATLEECYLRISQDQLIDIICKCISKKKCRFYEELFKLVRKCVTLDSASSDSVSMLLEAIINIVRNPNERAQINSLNAALFTLRKKNRVLTEVLDKAVSEEMPDFYNGIYRLETSIEEDADMSVFLESYIAQVHSENETQGIGGSYFGRGDQPHISIKRILERSTVKISEYLIDSAFREACDTLLRDSQVIEAKVDAIELLVYLVKSQPNIKERNNKELAELLSNKPKIESAHSIMTNLSETNLHLSALFLYICLGENVIAGLLETLAEIRDDASSNLRASVIMLNYLEADSAPLPDIQLEHIILQQSIKWSVDTTLDIRWHAVLILFSLLRNDENKSIICNQLVKLMDNDNVYIKNRILRKIHLLKNIDTDTYKYIIQKGNVDTNYVVRLVANEISNENT